MNVVISDKISFPWRVYTTNGPKQEKFVTRYLTISKADNRVGRIEKMYRVYNISSRAIRRERMLARERLNFEPTTEMGLRKL